MGLSRPRGFAVGPSGTPPEATSITRARARGLRIYSSLIDTTPLSSSLLRLLLIPSSKSSGFKSFDTKEMADGFRVLRVRQTPVIHSHSSSLINLLPIYYWGKHTLESLAVKVWRLANSQYTRILPILARRA